MCSWTSNENGWVYSCVEVMDYRLPTMCMHCCCAWRIGPWTGAILYSCVWPFQKKCWKYIQLSSFLLYVQHWPSDALCLSPLGVVSLMWYLLVWRGWQQQTAKVPFPRSCLIWWIAIKHRLLNILLNMLSAGIMGNRIDFFLGFSFCLFACQIISLVTMQFCVRRMS